MKKFILLLALIAAPSLVFAQATENDLIGLGINSTVAEALTSGLSSDADLTLTAGGDDVIITATDDVVVQGGGAGDIVTLAGGGTAVDLTVADNLVTVASGTDLTMTSGDLTITTGTLIQTEVQFIPAARGRAGGTATVGYVNTGVDTTMVTLAASATADTWVIPLDGVNIGDTVTGFTLIGQLESAGGAVTVDAAMRKMTMAAADPTDAAFGTACAITQISKTADYEISDSKTACSETLATGEIFYLLITTTTAASTDVQLAGIELTLTKGN